MAVDTVPRLRPEIRRSWERSAMCGLEHDSALQLPYDGDLQATEQFMRAAEPVIDRVGDFLAGARTTVILSDARGRILLRKCGDQALARLLDSTFSMPGFSWSEEHTGTTALSLAIEERMPAWVGPREHYLEALHRYACAAVPVIHPITHRMQGVVDVTAAVGDSSRHMMAVALQAARAIEGRLYDDASAIEQALLSRFLAVAGSTRQIVVLGERVEFCTPAAARLLDVGDRTLLWERASEMIKAKAHGRQSFTLSDGREITAEFNRVDVGSRPVGVVIEIELSREGLALRSAGPHGPLRPTGAEWGNGGTIFVGRSAVSRYLRDQAAMLQAELMPIVIAGEAGVGKLTLAKAIAGGCSEQVLLDAARVTIEGEDELLQQVAEVALSVGKTVIVRRIGCLSSRAVQALTAIAASAEAYGSRLVVTATVAPDATEGAHASGGSVADAFGLRLEVPPLRSRVDDLIDLVPYLVARRGATARVSPAVVQTLMRYDWPGNVRELDGLVRALLTRKRTTDIVLADLPPGYHRGGRRLRRIEHVERAAIMQALFEVDGNKTRAAEILEIGRATLYRKIRAYGLDLELSTS
jgi:sigma-54 dependent transcriptional regulator, acetoin dehydrogenase operon transcriptional activator AcoR